MKIGYARVSTDDQHLDLQIDALESAGCEKIFTDKTSGSKKSRPGLDAALEFARADDVLVIWRLDRLGRSLKDLIELVQLLESNGVQFQSLTEEISTTSAGGKLFFHMFGALAEFERNQIRERTQAGLAAARARGRKGGRPRKLNPEQQKQIRILSKSGTPITDIAQSFGVSRVTVYKTIKY